VRGARYESAEITDVGWFVADPEWVLEQKLDGMRCLATVDADGMTTFTSHTGEPLKSGTKHFAAIAAVISALRGVTLDGELLEGGAYWVFDILVAAGTDVRDLPLATRRSMLETVAPAFAGPVALVPQARTMAAKAELWERIVAAGAEGAVAKRTTAGYATGKTRTRDILKLKQTRTLDCVVVEVGRKGHESARLGLYRDGELVEIGACSLIGKPKVQAGDVIEVTALGFSVNALVQARLMRTRPDKTAAECGWDQLDNCRMDKRVLA